MDNWKYVVIFFVDDGEGENETRHFVKHFVLYEEAPSLKSIENNKNELVNDEEFEAGDGLVVEKIGHFVLPLDMVHAISESSIESEKKELVN